VNFWIVWNH